MVSLLLGALAGYRNHAATAAVTGDGWNERKQTYGFSLQADKEHARISQVASQVRKKE